MDNGQSGAAEAVRLRSIAPKVDISPNRKTTIGTSLRNSIIAFQESKMTVEQIFDRLIGSRSFTSVQQIYDVAEHLGLKPDFESLIESGVKSDEAMIAETIIRWRS